MGKPSPKYTAEFKQQAVRPYGERGGTYAEIARELEVDAGSISDWVKRADAAQAPAGDNPFQMAEELRRLRRENERLKRKNEILLKASAFFAGRQLWARGRRGRSSLSSCSTRAPGACPRCAPR